MTQSLHVCKEFVVRCVLMNEPDGTNGTQNGHSAVHHHYCYMNNRHQRVLWVAHFEDCKDWEDEVQRCEPNRTTESHKVPKEGDGSCNESDHHNVHCGHPKPHQAVVQAQGRLVVVHHFILNEEVGWAAINLHT